MFPSNKLYESVSLNEYELIKNEALNNLSNNYSDLSLEEKWELIIAEFVKLPLCDADASDLIEKIQTFATKRTNKAFHNQYNIPLEDCLLYFENFYFIYSTNNPKFKLTQSQANEFLLTLQDALEMCETGKKTRFEAILKQYQTDCDWIKNNLFKWRYNILLAMYDKYNALNHIEDEFQVHVLLIMSELAKNYQLGIESNGQDLQDVHANSLNKNHIVKFFHDNVIAAFLEYEKNILTNLTQHIVCEVQSRFCTKNNENGESTVKLNWEKDELILSGQKLSDFLEFIDEHLKCSDGFSFMSLIECNDDYAAVLLKQKEFSKLVKLVLKRKLLLEGYFISVDQFTRDNTPYLRENLRLMLPISSKDIIRVNEIIKNQESFNWQELKTYKNIIFMYPDLILQNIHKFPGIIHSLPPELKNNPRFLEDTLLYIEGIVCDNQISTNESYANVLLDIIKLTNNSLCLSSIFLDFNLSKELVKRNGLILQFLPRDLRNNEEIVSAAVHQNPFALIYANEGLQTRRTLANLLLKQFNSVPFVAESQSFYEQIRLIHTHLKNNLPASLNEQFNDLPKVWEKNPTDMTLICFNIKQMQIIYQLLNNARINSIELFVKAQLLNPELLVKVITERKHKKFPALQFVANVKYLKHFNNALVNENFNNWNNGFWNTRRRASESILTISTDNLNRNIMHYITKNNSWILAMMQYEADNLALTGFQSFTEALLQLFETSKANLKFSMSLLYVLTTLTLTIALSTFIGLRLYQNLSQNFVETFTAILAGVSVTGIISLLPTLFCRINLEEALFTFRVSCMLPFITLINALMFCNNTIFMHTIPALQKASNLNYLFLFKILNTIFTSDPFDLNKEESDLLTRCYTRILQLRLMQKDVADEGADLLQSLLDNVLSNWDISIEELTQNDNTALEAKIYKALSNPQHCDIRGENITISLHNALQLAEKDFKFVEKLVPYITRESSLMRFFTRRDVNTPQSQLTYQFN